LKILIVGASGMLGQTLFRVASQQSDLEVYGTAQAAPSYIRVNALALLHLCGEKISKYQLLVLAKDIFYKTEITVRPDENYICDRSLTSSRLSALGITVPSLRQMLIELRDFN
jgi:hypothetical protein